MASWRAREAIKNTVIIAVIAGAGYYGYLYFSGQASDSRSDCDKRRGEILEACEPECAASEHYVPGIHDTSNRRVNDDCLEECSQKRFNERLPECKSRRVHRRSSQ